MVYSFARFTIMRVRVADGHVDGAWIIKANDTCIQCRLVLDQDE
jgi:hypothetical protein